MLTKKVLMSLMLAAGMIGAAATPFATSAATNIELNFGSPAYYEAVPAPRAGYVWVPGYRAWDGYRYVWHRGHWERAHRGYAYRDGRWHAAPSRWDSDGDGVPNRYDARPRNPYRY